jgi:hypothetical protein
MKVAVNPEVEMKILKWGPKAEVMEPATLRETFAGYAGQSAAQYGV